MTSSNDSAGYLWAINATRWFVDDSNETLGIDWDDWDVSLWTSEQRQLLEHGGIPRQVHVALGVLLSFIVLFGFAANSTILYVFSRFKRLRTPANVFIINLTICDFLACCLHPLAVYSAFRGRWSFGQTGCNWYGMGVAFFGLNSIVTLSAIACERYIVITSSSCRPVVAKWRITRRQAQKVCAGIWLHCAALVSPPLLFGWSSYLPEGVLVTCSWDYTSRTTSNRLYYFYLLSFGFFLPVSVLTFCYAAIFRFILRSSKEITRLIMTSDGTTTFSKSTVTFRKRRRQTDVRTALIILSLAILCFTAWTPYTIVSLIGQFGPVDEDGELKLSPMATAIPSFLAKTAIVFDPLVYGFSSPQFRNSVRQILRQQSISSSGNAGNRAGPNNMAMTRTAIQNSRASSHATVSSFSRNARMFPKDPLSKKTSNDPSVSTPPAVQQIPQFRLPTDVDINEQQFRRGENLGKSCMKRKDSFKIPAGSISQKNKLSNSRCSLLEDVSTHSLALRQMIFRKEDELYLFHHQPSHNAELAANKMDHQGNNKRIRRRFSEADVMRRSGKFQKNLLLVSTSFDFDQ